MRKIFRYIEEFNERNGLALIGFENGLDNYVNMNGELLAEEDFIISSDDMAEFGWSVIRKADSEVYAILFEDGSMTDWYEDIYTYYDEENDWDGCLDCDDYHIVIVKDGCEKEYKALDSYDTLKKDLVK